jgi:hypothetical protein
MMKELYDRAFATDPAPAGEPSDVPELEELDEDELDDLFAALEGKK